MGMLEAMGTGEGRVRGGDGGGCAEAGERGEHRRHRILAGRPQRLCLEIQLGGSR
jgi:hypothetical protein